jgi:integrase/recombinase XerD
MLESYFVRPGTVDRIRASWIGVPIEQYVAWLAEQGYAVRNVLRRVPILVRFGAFSADRGAKSWSDLPAHIDAFVAAWAETRYARANAAARRKEGAGVRNVIEQMLRFALPDHAAVNHRSHMPDPFVDRASGFFAYLRDERGLRETSIRQYRHFLRRFEVYLGRISCRELRALSPPIISAFITESADDFGPRAMIGQCSALRVFLRYLQREGIVKRDLSRGIEPPQVYRLADLPRSIGWDEVRRMLEAVDRRTPVGRRDYAILYCLSPTACGHARSRT